MDKRYQIRFFIAILLVICINGISQISEDGKKNFQKAESFLSKNDYSSAVTLFLSVLREDPKNSNINYRVGECYINIQGQERKALPYLLEAIKEVDENYKPGQINNTAAAPKAWLYLGDAFHRDERIEDASKAYHTYKDYVADDEDELNVVAERLVGIGVTMDQLRVNEGNIVLTNLGEKINTKYSDYNIIFSGDQKTKVFTSYQKRTDIIYASYLKDNKWTDPIEITDQIGSVGDMYAGALSYDGKELYLVLITPYDADIYVSEFKNGEWGYADNIGRSINSKYVESNVAITADGNRLYFSSDRAASIGGFDIFYSDRVDGKWSKAKNLGEIVNSEDNEETPFITNNGKDLYFSSDRSGSIGRMDVYLSKLSNDEWSIPENMGIPYNSVEDDIAFKLYEPYGKGYIARDIPGGFGKLDLYLIQSGENRQKELADYMASIRSEKPVIIEEPAMVAEVEPVVEVPVSVPTPVVAPVVPVVTPKVVAVSTPKPKPESEPEPVVVKAEPEVIIEPVKSPITVKEPEIKPEPIAEVKKAPVVVGKPIHKPSVKEKEKVVQSFDGEYTIQVMALIFPKTKKKIVGLDENLIHKAEGNDGYTRYLYGRYSSRDEAINALRYAFSKGYKGAYIRKVSDISNF